MMAEAAPASTLRRRRRSRAIAAAIVAGAGLAGAAGWWRTAPRGASGATHPESRLPAAAPSAIANPVEWAWAGGLTSSSIVVKARIARPSERVRLLVGEDEALTDAIASPYTAASEDGFRIAELALGGLRPATRYRWAVEVDGEVDGGVDAARDRLGAFRTPADGAFSFTFAFGSCARTGSNGAVFDTIRGHDPLFFLHLGDLHYENLDLDDAGAFLRTYGWVLASPAQSRLYRSAPIVYVFDDHDFGGNNSDGTVGSRSAAQRLYRAAAPSHPLVSATGPIHRAFTIGRVRFVVTDGRSERTPRRRRDGPAKTVLGTEQRAWLERELTDAARTRALTVWVNATPWIGAPDGSADHWGGYARERGEIAAFLERHGIDRLVMLSGDAHMLAIDDGSNNRYGPSGGAGFPVFQAAALDRRGSRKGGPYSGGEVPGGGHFGLMTVEDSGDAEVRIVWSGRDWQDRELMRLERTFAVPPLDGL